MENGDPNLNQWVDERMARLEASPAWRPNPDRVLAGVRHKQRVVRRRRWSLGIAGAAALASALFTIPGCQAATCKVRSENLAERLWNTVFVPSPAPKPQPEPQQFAPSPAPALPQPEPPNVTPPKANRVSALPTAPTNFKESGSSTAAITIEFYTDYACPACAQFYLEVLPQLNAGYVATGKIKLLHRDFPLVQHQYSRLAARYANAAGIAGAYEIAAAQLFRTQSAWGLSGDIDAQLAQVLPADVMDRVRDLVRSDPDLDTGVSADLEQGRADRIMRTPSVVLLFHGERRLVGTGDYSVIKAMLDHFLSHP